MIFKGLLTRFLTFHHNFVIKFVSDLRQVDHFHRILRIPHQLNWPSRYNWNIVESGAKHNNHYPGLWGSTLFIWFAIITYLWLVYLFCEGLPIIFYLIMIIFHVLWRSTYYCLPDHENYYCFVEVYLSLPYHD